MSMERGAISACLAGRSRCFTHRRQAGRGWLQQFPARLSDHGRTTMKQSEFQTYHQREAARLRRLIANATTPALKARLIEQAGEHEQLAEGFEEDAEALYPV